MYGTVSKKIVHNQNENINCDAQPILNCKAKPTAREKESDGNMSSLLETFVLRAANRKWRGNCSFPVLKYEKQRRLCQLHMIHVMSRHVFRAYGKKLPPTR